MNFDIQFYREFLSWIEKKGAIVASNTPARMPQFLSEVVSIFRVLFAMFGDFTACFRGNALSIALNLAGWAKRNKDPLATTREAIRGMYNKWGAL